MKRTISILVILLTLAKVNATNYYLSSSSGNDVTNDGKSANTPWQSIDKLKSVLGLLQPGDSVFFKCDGVYDGQLTLTQSGTASKNIWLGSYSTGKKPVISGTTTVANWIQTSANIWEATCMASSGRVTNFFINGIPQQMGRWPNATDPNKGYLSYEMHSGTNQITDEQLTGDIDWTGAEAVVRRVRWILDRLSIKTHNAQSLVFTTNVNYEFTNGYGYFIQNHLRTLDQQGEWYFNRGSKKFSLFSKIDPNTLSIKSTSLDNLLRMNGLSYITIENLKFSGSYKLTMDIDYCNHLIIKNCDIDYSGENGVDINSSNNVLFECNLINHTNNNALVEDGCKNLVMRNNIIKNTALIAGMGLSGDGQYNAVQMNGTHVLFERNLIDSVGYIGMNFNGDTITIQNNVISNYCMTKDDGGGLYTWSSGTKNYSRKLIGNILLNAVGAAEGATGNVAAEGIYIDDRSSNVDVIDNTIYKCGNNGIYIHNADHINIKGNHVYDNNVQLVMRHDNIAQNYPITNCVVDSNVFVARDAKQWVASFENTENVFSGMGTFDYNAYCRPLDDRLTLNVKNGSGSSLTLDNWRTIYKQDQHSSQSPITVAKYKVLGIASGNYFNNPDFEGTTSNWSGWSLYNNSRTTIAKGEGNPGNALKTTFISSSGKPGAYMVLSSHNIALESGKSYRLRFSAKSSNPAIVIKMIPRKYGDPSNEIADRETFTPGIGYSDFEFLLFPSKSESSSRIEFEIPEFHGSIWFDNFEFIEVTGEKANPDDYIRFEYNATVKDKTIHIPANYVDVKGKAASGEVVLKPFSSILLFKNLTTSIGHLPKPENPAIRLLPNPARKYVTIESKETILSICLHDINGRIIKSYNNSGETTAYTIQNLPAPGVYIVQIQTKGRTENRKLFINN